MFPVEGSFLLDVLMTKPVEPVDKRDIHPVGDIATMESSQELTSTADLYQRSKHQYQCTRISFQDILEPKSIRLDLDAFLPLQVD